MFLRLLGDSVKLLKTNSILLSIYALLMQCSLCLWLIFSGYQSKALLTCHVCVLAQLLLSISGNFSLASGEFLLHVSESILRSVRYDEKFTHPQCLFSAQLFARWHVGFVTYKLETHWLPWITISVSSIQGVLPGFLLCMS